MAEQKAILTLREYKAQIDDLKKSLGDLENGTTKYSGLLNQASGTLSSNIKQLAEQKNALDDLKQQYKDGTISQEKFLKEQKQLSISMSELNRTINIQQKLANASEGSYNDLSQTLSLLKNAYKQLNDEEKMSVGGQEMAADISLLDQYLKDTSADFGEFQRNVGDYGKATVSLKAQLKELNDQMSQMLYDGVKPTDEAFVTLAEQAGKVKDAIADAKSVTKEYSNDVKGMQAVLDVASTGVAVFGAWKSTMSLFGIESEKATKVIETMTTVTTLLNSLQTINKALFDDSTATYRMFHTVLQAVGLEEKANTVGLTAHEAAMKADAVATQGATVATNTFKKALISTGIGALVVLVGTLAANWDKVVDAFKGVDKEGHKAADALEDILDASEDATKQFVEQRAETMRDAQSLQKLATDYKAANNELAKTQILEEATNLMNKYGIELNSADEYARALVNDTPKIVEAIKLQGEAAALAAIRMEEYKKAFTERVNEMYELEKGIGITRNEVIEQTMFEFENQDVIRPWDAIDKKLSEIKTKYNGLLSSIGVTGKKNTTKTTGGGGGGGSNENPELKRIEQQIAQQQLLNELKQKSYEIAREYDEEDKGLSENAKAKLEIDAIDNEIDALKALNKIYEDAAKNSKLSKEDRIKYAQDVAKTEMEINNLLDQRILTNYKNRLAEQERAEEEHEENIKRLKNSQLNEIDLNAAGEENEIAQQYINGEISYKDYQQRLKDIQTQANIEKLEIEKQFALDNLTTKTLMFNEAAAKYDADTEAYKQALRDKEDAEQLYNESQINLNKAKNDKIIADNERAAKEEQQIEQRKVNNTKKFLSATSALFGGISNILEKDIENKKKNGDATENELDREFKAMKAFQISQTIIGMIAGGVGTWFEDMKNPAYQIPPGLKYAMAAIDLSTIIATGTAQIQQIASQKFDPNSSGTGGAISTGSVSNSGVSVMPLLNETADANTLQSLQTDAALNGNSDNRVYILQSDITDSNNQVDIRENNTTY